MGSCPNESRHSGRNAQSHNLSKGGRCLINCICGSKLYLHNAVVATLAKRINGKGFDAKPGEAIIHQTVCKQADITVRPMSDIGKPFYVDVTVIQQESNLKSAPRLKLTKSNHIDCCEDMEGKFVSRNHIFRKGTSHKLKAYVLDAPAALNSLTSFKNEEYAASYSFRLFFAAPSRLAALFSLPRVKCTSMWVKVAPVLLITVRNFFCH